MKKRNGAKTIAVVPGKKLLSLLMGMFLVMSMFSPLAGKVAYAFDQLGGGGTEDDPWQITNRQQLSLIGYAQYSYSSPYILMNDIDLSGEDWFPIRYLSGTLDGNGKKISGLEIDMPDDDNVGLFSKIIDGHVYNLTVELGEGGIIGHDNVGIIAGAVEQTDDNSASIMFVSAKGDVTGNHNVGGLVGKVTGYETSNLVSAYNHIGPGTVKGTTAVGGLAGYWKRGFVYNSHAEAAVEPVVGAGERMGGLLGYAADSKVRRSYSTGTVGTFFDRKDYVGGLIGKSLTSQIYASYSTGEVLGYNYVGGLIGSSGYDSISHSYAAGDLDATGDQAGGLIGFNEESQSVVKASYWNTGAPGTIYNDNSDPDLYGTGRNSEEMKDEATFTSDTDPDNNWDFEHVWYMENGHYPQLYAGMDIRFDVEPSYVSGRVENLHDLTIGMKSDLLGYGHDIRVYQAGDDDTPKAAFRFPTGTQAAVPFTLDTSDVNDGTHQFNDGFYFMDQYRNRTSVFYPSVFVDSTSPVWGDGASFTKNVTGVNVELSWDAATDDGGSGIDHYNVYVNGVSHQVATTTDTFTAPLSPAIYEVEAVDRAGNTSTTRLSLGGTPSTTTLSGTRNVAIGQSYVPSYSATVLGAPSYNHMFSYIYGGTLNFYVDGVVQMENVPLTSAFTGLTPYGAFPLNNYNNLSEGVHTIKAVYSGYTGDFHGTNYTVSPSEGTFDITVSGLNVTSSDPSGAANNGKTKLEVTPAASAGHKFVYRNFGSSDVIVPDIGYSLNLNDYTDLPSDGLVSANSFDKIGVVEIETLTGTVVHFGQTTAVVIAEPTVNTPTPGTSTPGTSTPASSTDNVEVLVNGKVENLGKAKTSEADGVKTTTVTVDPAKLQAKLDAEGSHAIVTIPVKSPASTIVGELNGQIVKNMENASATLVLKTDKATYTLPAQQINIDAISAKAGKSVALQDIKVQIEIAAPTADTVKWVENAAEKGTFTLVAPPVEFTVRGTFGDQTVEVSQFNAYVERTIAIPDGVDASKITTGVVIDQDGTVRHVPTKVVVIDGKPYAKINSLTNSTYSVVWHPLVFADMAKHWAKDAVNDMGSRMVIEGTGNGLFSPDRAITRAEFAAIVVRGLGLKLESGASAFPDVKASDWYSGAVNAAVKQGLISGFEDGAFRPNESITREQAMTIIAKAMKVTGLKDELLAQSADAVLSTFTDTAEASNWAKTDIADSVQAGIVSGRGGADLAPKAYVTRAEVAMMVRILLQKSDLI